MIITSVSYGKLVSREGYGNEKISATAGVEVGEDANDVLNGLKHWVCGKLGAEQEARDLSATIHHSRITLSDLKEQIVEMRDRWERARQLLTAHGVEVPAWAIYMSDEAEPAKPAETDGGPF